MHACSVFSQGIPIGQWRDHLSYKNGIAITEGGGKIYCLTTGGLFSLNTTDNSIERLSKITGLSGTNFKTINFNKYNNTLVIGYDDGNIDLIQNNSVITIPDIKRAVSVTGSRQINKIYFINELAYLACGFGIVVLNTEKLEIKDTYYIAPGGASTNVYDINSDGSSLIAATSTGLYKASLNNPNLAQYTNWTGLRSGIYNAVAVFNGNIVANKSAYLKNPEDTANYNKDTVFIFNNGTWAPLASKPYKYIVTGLTATSEYLLIANGNVDVYDTSYALRHIIYAYGFDWLSANQAILYNNSIWFADGRYGLFKNNFNTSLQNYIPNGPGFDSPFDLYYLNDKIHVLRGAYTMDIWNTTWTWGGLSVFEGESWSTFNETNTPEMIGKDIRDMVNIIGDPKYPGKYYIGTWLSGLVEFNDGKITDLYNETNSPLKRYGHRLPVGGLAFDDNNLWISNGESDYGLVLKSGSSWYPYNISTSGIALTEVVIDNNNNKWILAPRVGNIYVFNEAGTLSNTSDDNLKVFSCPGFEFNSDPCAQIYAMVKDIEGDIWIGSDKGIAVFYSPENAFSDGYSPQQILIEQDGHTQILLETESITAIAVDGANQKWIGTANSGVFLVSADGTKTIYHFDKDNSPLLSNEIKSIGINQKTGEVFFGTSAGLISYRSTATEGLEDYENVYAFPNPVLPDYEGTIAIKGLVKDAAVKITDINGGLVYSTKAEGGQATWNGKNFNGEKAATGVYLVFCSNEDGSKTFITKILVMN